MTRHFSRFAVVSALLFLAASASLAAGLDKPKKYSKWERAAYLTTEQIEFIRPGLTLSIDSLVIPGDTRRPRVVFTITDDRGQPLDRDGILTPGAVTTSWILSRINAGDTQYTAYTTRTQTSPITGGSALQPSSDSGGVYRKVAEGTYEYTFGTALPAGYPRNVTTTLGVYSTRDLRPWEMTRHVTNEVFSFVPDGTAVQTVRDVVRTQNCNQCHNPLAMHGGSRRDTRLCILCHSTGYIDPDTGNTIDFKVMVHKIHRGEDLPSVQAGTPYQIIGFRQSVHDFSEVVLPQDIRNCDKCHQSATQGSNWFLNPTRDSCGSCHDLIDWETGSGHVGGRQVSDRFCANCHFAEGEVEFDASVKGGHTIPRQSTQLRGINIQITRVINTRPGQSPTVFFDVTENDGRRINPSGLGFFNFNLIGPTTDYSTLIRESARTASVPLVPLGTGFSYTFEGRIPSDATGSFAVGAEAFRMVTLNPGTTDEMEFRETEEQNPVFYFGVTDPQPVPRRAVVSEARCNNCHGKLALHGTIRHDPEYCVTCHIPSGTDVDRRPAAEMPPESRHFKFMIHRIHSGHDLTRDFTVYGFGNQPHNYNELHFPGDRRDCETCHVNDSYEIPLPEGLLPTLTLREFFSPMPPIAAACLGCHDSRAAAAHAFVMIAPFGEGCAACHGPNSAFAVEKVHAR